MTKMEALILAAGYGSRIRGLSACKPLTPVQGVPLVELAVRAAMRAGVRRVVIATGHEADRLEAALAEIADRLDIEIEAVRIADHARPNGWSVMAGASRIAGDYLLMMADHVLSWRILDRLAACGDDDRGVTLAVDHRTASPLIDPADATWVRHGEASRIARIGKGLPVFDAVDCGAFLATPELAEAISAAIAAGRPGSLSDGMQVLADAGRAATMDIGSEWWIDVDDPVAHAQAEDLVAGHLDDVAAGPMFFPAIFSAAMPAAAMARRA